MATENHIDFSAWEQRFAQKAGGEVCARANPGEPARVLLVLRRDGLDYSKARYFSDGDFAALDQARAESVLDSFGAEILAAVANPQRFVVNA